MVKGVCRELRRAGGLTDDELEACRGGEGRTRGKNAERREARSKARTHAHTHPADDLRAILPGNISEGPLHVLKARDIQFPIHRATHIAPGVLGQ